MACEHEKQTVMIELGLGVTRCLECGVVLRNGQVVGWFKESDRPGYFMFRNVGPPMWLIPMLGGRR